MERHVLLGEDTDEPISFDEFTSETAGDAPLEHPIWPITAKIARADYHLNILGREIRAFLDRGPNTYAHERADASSEYVWRVRVRERPDPRWGLLISEIAHHLNSALDHLVWLVAETHTEGRPPNGTGFPIATVAADFRRAGNRSSGYHRTRAMPAHAQAIVEDEQPYHQGHAFEGQPLWILRRLANGDKHETLVTVGAASGQGSAEVLQEGGEVEVDPVTFFDGPVEDGDVVASWPLPPAGAAGMKIHLDVRFSSYVAFPKANAGQGREVMGTLLELRNRVNQVRNRLAPFIGGKTSV